MTTTITIDTRIIMAFFFTSFDVFWKISMVSVFLKIKFEMIQFIFMNIQFYKIVVNVEMKKLKVNEDKEEIFFAKTRIKLWSAMVIFNCLNLCYQINYAPA